MSIALTIDGHSVDVQPGQTVLDAARKLGIDIPTLCYLEKCGPLNTCLVCLVKVNGKLVPSCGTRVEPGMVVESETNEVHEARKTALELLFSDHVGDCLSPCDRLCPLRMNIPVMIRHIQAGALDHAVATVRDALPLASVLGRLCHHPCEQGCRRATWDQSAGIREMERFVSDWDLGLAGGRPRRVDFTSGNARAAGQDAVLPYLPTRQPSTGKSVAIVGAGPVGMTAAYHLLRQGHDCTITDRHEQPGGTLRRNVDEKALPRNVLDAEVRQLERLGARFKLKATLGQGFTIDGLLRDFDAILLAVGEISKAEAEALGLQSAPGGIKADPKTYETNVRGVFAAGRAVKPVAQLVRAMSEGLAAAECIHQFLAGEPIESRSKPFTSIMGRLEKEELEKFVNTVNPAATLVHNHACGCLTESTAATEASRCLHCDCRSSGDCALQSYAQAYGADASRFKQERRKFEQWLQPGGVIFEPGKCILCGICVKLTEMAREPLGLTFIGRGFDVRVAVPFDRALSEGLQKVAEECVRYCPTGALVFADSLPQVRKTAQPGRH